MKRTVAAAPHLRRAGLLLAIAGLAVIAFETLLPEPGVATGTHLCLLCGYVGGVSSILNVLLFVPLGLGLALHGWPAKRAVPAMFALSALIEVTQYFFISGRYSTIGDVITNSMGGALGFALGLYASNLLRPSPRLAVVLTIGWSAIWIGVEAITAFGFSPSIPRSTYYGQIAPVLGQFEEFQGRVLDASVGDVPIPHERIDASNAIRERLLGGAMVTTTIVPTGNSPGIAPIVRVVDDREREIMLVALQAQDVVFAVRTGASLLRLRPPVFALPEVLPRATAGPSGESVEAITLRTRYSAREVWLESRSAIVIDRHIPLTASLGWTMFLPFQWLIAGSRVERLLSILWIVCLVLPLGYWGASVVRRAALQTATRLLGAAGIGTALLYVGLVAVPHVFGMTGATFAEWSAAAVGMLGGTLLRLTDPQRVRNRLPVFRYQEGGVA